MEYTKEEKLNLALQDKCGCIFNINCSFHKSVPLLYEKLNKVRKWLVQLASSAEKKIETERFITLRDAYIADAKMYRATITDIDKALALAEGREIK